MTGETINLVPEATHDFIDVEDVVDGILALSKNRQRGIFELGTGKSYTNQEVLEIVEKATGKKTKVNYVKNMRPYDNPEWFSVNYKARSYGWYPKKTLKDSVSEMVKAYKNVK